MFIPHMREITSVSFFKKRMANRVNKFAKIHCKIPYFTNKMVH